MRSDLGRYLLAPVVNIIVMMFAVLPLTTYYLDPEDIGLYALITALVLPVSNVGAAGPRWFIGGHFNVIEEQERSILIFNVLLFELLFRGVLLLGVALFAESLLRSFLTEFRTDYIDMLHIVLLAVAVHVLWSPISFLMTVNRDSNAYMAVSIIQTITNFLALVLFLWLMEMGVESLFYALLATNSVSLLLAVLYVRKRLTPQYSPSIFRHIWANQLRAIPGGFFELVSSLVERFSIQAFLGIKALGYYAHSQQYNLGIKMVNGALTNAVTPRALETYASDGDSTKIKELFPPWYGLLSCVGVLIALFSDEFVAYLTHGKFTESAVLVPIWFLMAYSVAHSIPYAQFLVAKKQRDTLMYSQVIPTVGGIFLVFLGAWLGNIIYVAFAMVATNVLIQVWRYRVAKRLGFESVGNRSFSMSILLYLMTWLFEYSYRPEIVTEVIVGVVMITLLIVLFRLPTSLKVVLNI